MEEKITMNLIQASIRPHRPGWIGERVGELVLLMGRVEKPREGLK